MKILRGQGTGIRPESLEDVAEIVRMVGERLMLHNKLEEESLYPLADGLTTEKGSELADSIEAELANLPQRFRPNDS
jgi:hypothetical protein